MTGYNEWNFPAFDSVAAGLRSVGFDVFNPAERDRADGFDPTGMDGTEDLASVGFDLREALRIDLSWICDCAEGLAVLEGWERSAGARAEVALARALGLPVMHAEDLIVGRVVDVTESSPKREDECVDVQESALIEAQRLIHGPRQSTYGHPADDFARTALHWQAILGMPVTARQVALCMVGVKLSRLSETPDHRDSIVDSVGYLGCYELIADREAE